ncbi:hypothetical protein PCCS19_44310 [Paenibacillus sp. CCS19]|uniref:anti-sigma factor family protein n=1 Tax=Paenibacillus sp. CCS19 TaxID=3158387 RepID=UPI00256C12A2|nr:zf-HC2 domain-containing protein [Paenibacillus cellulosilyticus]GMK41375.1 hypothetical protein PCCS19_44310 [Paenibacillus cellulosilyticus]
MNCQEVMAYMQRQLDHDLEDHEAEVLFAHIRHCSDCADTFERLKRLSLELESLPKVVPAFSLVDAIMPQLDQLVPEISAAVAEPDQPAESGVTSRRTSRKREGGWLRNVSWTAIGGVVTAGIVVGLVLVLANPITPSKSDDSAELKSAEMSTATADTSASSTEAAADSAFEKNVHIQSPEVSTKGVNKDNGRSVTGGSDDGSDAADANTFTVQSPYTDLPADPSVTNDYEVAPPKQDVNANAASTATETSGAAGTAGEEALNKKDAPALIAKDQYGEPMAITSTGASKEADISNVLVSPSGTLSAAVVDQAVFVYAAQEGTVLLDSGKMTGEISGLTWSDDSVSLFFIVKDQEGTTTQYKVDTKDWSVKKQ